MRERSVRREMGKGLVREGVIGVGCSQGSHGEREDLLGNTERVTRNRNVRKIANGWGEKGIMRLEGSGEPKRDFGQKRNPGTEEVLENADSGEIWSRKKKKTGESDSKREVGQRKPEGHRKGDRGAITDWDLVTGGWGSEAGEEAKVGQLR